MLGHTEIRPGNRRTARGRGGASPSGTMPYDASVAVSALATGRIPVANAVNSG